MSDRSILPVLGQRMAEFRKQRGITQEDLATAIDMSRGSVANIEAGRQEPGIGTLVAIARALEVTTDDLTSTSPTAADRSPWLDLAKRNTASERTYDRLAEDSWRAFDVNNALRYRGMADGLRVARDNHLSVVRDMNTPQNAEEAL